MKTFNGTDMDNAAPIDTETPMATIALTATMTATLASTPTEPPPAPFTGAAYTYDGDDNLVKSVVNGITTYYAASSYVVETNGTTTTVRKTYLAGSTSLAVRTIINGTQNTLNWTLSDHLGSSSVTTTANGTWYSELRYSAFGETRYSSGITPTDYRYTGQLEQADVNLYYYNARWYDPELGRFIQADTIIPGAGDSKSYDRYAYVNNNPVRYTDPSGHGVPYGVCEIAGGSIPQCQKQGGSPANMPKYAPPTGLSDSGKNAWDVLNALGFLNNLEAAMEYIVNTEFSSEQLENVQDSTTLLTKSITRKYYQFCSSDPWGADCVQSFWGYMQGITDYFADPDYYTSKENEQSTSIANAILNPGTVAYTIKGTDVIMDPIMAQEKCNTGGLCDWAIFPKKWADDIIALKNLGDGEVYYESENQQLYYWQKVDIDYLHVNEFGTYDFNEAIYIYEFGTNEYQVFFDEKTKLDLCTAGYCY
jgi:RHS repeat-associated protein